MTPHRASAFASGAACVLAVLANAAGAFQPVVTYQGRLRMNGQPVTGECDFEVRLFDAPSGGRQLAVQAAGAVPVTDGVFTLPLHLPGSAFDGGDRYLQVAVGCPAGGGPSMTLAPRQLVGAAPHALLAERAASAAGLACTGCVNGATIAGLAITADKLANGAVGGAAIAPGAVLGTHLAAGAVGPGHIGVGVVEPRHLSFTPGTVTAITAGPGLTGGTITTSGAIAVAFGTQPGTVSAGDHRHDADYWRIGGNAAGGGDPALGTLTGHALDVRVGGERALRLQPATVPNLIGGWSGNAVGPAVVGAAVAGGGSPDADEGRPAPNRVLDSHGSIGGGAGNLAGSDNGNPADARYAAVAGGAGNRAIAEGASVGGGAANTAGGVHATVGGGVLNAAGGVQATVPGGGGNVANGAGSFAAGRLAWATHDGAFLWGDGSTLAVSQGTNSFAALATGGFHFYFTTTGGHCRLTSAAGWQCASGSDRALKTTVGPVDPAAVLEQVAALPLARWRYTDEEPPVEHIGPAAQDFRAAFGVGRDGRTIDTVDADGVALAAIQGLHARLAEQAAEIAALRAAAAALAARLGELEAACLSR